MKKKMLSLFLGSSHIFRFWFNIIFLLLLCLKKSKDLFFQFNLSSSHDLLLYALMFYKKVGKNQKHVHPYYQLMTPVYQFFNKNESYHTNSRKIAVTRLTLHYTYLYIINYTICKMMINNSNWMIYYIMLNNINEKLTSRTLRIISIFTFMINIQ